MASFPRTEAEILMLAQAMQTGLADHLVNFPAPPFSAAELHTALDNYVSAKNGALNAQAVATGATALKNAALETLVDEMKADLRYAEDKTHTDASQLQLLGWNVTAAPTPAPPLAPPGAVSSLAAPEQGKGWIILNWAAPLSGGAVSAYKIQLRLRPDGPWTDVGTALETTATLSTQERAKEW